MRQLRPRLWRIAAPLAVGASLLALWEIIVRAEDIPPYILPGPLLIAQTLWTDGPSLMGSLLVTLIVLHGQPGVAAIMLTALIWILIATINVVYATRQRPHQ